MTRFETYFVYDFALAMSFARLLKTHMIYYIVHHF